MANNDIGTDDKAQPSDEELSNNITAYIEHLQNLLNDPSARQLESSWLPIIYHPFISNKRFLERTGFTVFSAFVEYVNSQKLSLEGGFVPQAVVSRIATIYTWEQKQTELSNYFSKPELDNIFNYAIIYDNSSQTLPNESLSSIAVTDTVDEPATNISAADKPPKNKSLFSIFAFYGAILCAIYLLFWGFEKYKSSNVATLPATHSVQFDERLLACNKVTSAAPSSEFNTCLALANEDVYLAQKRMVWAYSRNDEYLNWQEAFNWLKRIKRRNQTASLLGFAFMNVLGNTTQLKETGERGITQFANRNFAPANIILASMYALEQNIFDPSSNPLWLLERAYEQSNAYIEPIDMAIIHANGFMGKTDLNKAKNILTSSAETFFPIGTNNVAWFLSTLQNNPFTEPNYAISLAQKVVEQRDLPNRFTYIDTLAASYAASGNFELAITTQKTAIQDIEDSDLSSLNKSRLVEEFNGRLAKYEAQETVVESELYIDKDQFFEQLKTRTLNALLNTFYTVITPPESASNKGVEDNENN